mmetsp:Transcript_66771/g.204343  ORF Transcript_66771/g.204343 Transcript_66771/m.204343 type:complete len:244 (-) Transcript_66771:3077-3808(-)
MSSLEATSVAASGDQTTKLDRHWMGSMTCVSWALCFSAAKSQMRIVASVLHVANCLGSLGEKLMLSTGASWPATVMGSPGSNWSGGSSPSGQPSSGSGSLGSFLSGPRSASMFPACQMRMHFSFPPESKWTPSPVKATAYNGTRSWPSFVATVTASVMRSAPVATSQILRMPSSLHEAINFVSGLKAHALIFASCGPITSSSSSASASSSTASSPSSTSGLGALGSGLWTSVCTRSASPFSKS